MDLSNKLSCEAGYFSHQCNSHRFLQPEVLRLYFPVLETLYCVVCLAPQLLLPVYPYTNVQLPSPPDAALPGLVWQLQPRQPSPPATSFPPVLSAPAAHLCPSYQSEWMFLLQLLGYWTSIQFNFLAVLVIFVFKFVIVLLVVWGSKVYLPIPPSWLEVLFLFSIKNNPPQVLDSGCTYSLVLVVI